MTRPLRIEFPGAVYHVTSRGNARQAIYTDNEDREAFLGLLCKIVDHCHWLCHAYCLMGNHYHLLIETPESNLPRGIRQPKWSINPAYQIVVIAGLFSIASAIGFSAS